MVLLRRLFFVLIATALALAAYGYFAATADPRVRRLELSLAAMPQDAVPIRAVLISDIHVAAPDMPPERLARIVGQINVLRPDIVLIAGDLISDKRLATRHYSMAEALRPLGGIRSRLGTVAVLGNHDHWYDPAGARRALREARVRLLDNEAIQLGPVAVGGIDDDFTGRANLPRVLEQLRGLTGPHILLSHSPDPFPDLPPTVPLMLAGHTHCGQVAPFGPIRTFSRYGRRYACGLVREGGKFLVVTAGLGTSGVPLRIGAPPDMWLITLRPGGARSPRR